MSKIPLYNCRVLYIPGGAGFLPSTVVTTVTSSFINTLRFCNCTSESSKRWWQSHRRSKPPQIANLGKAPQPWHYSNQGLRTRETGRKFAVRYLWKSGTPPWRAQNNLPGYWLKSMVAQLLIGWGANSATLPQSPEQCNSRGILQQQSTWSNTGAALIAASNSPWSMIFE